MLLARRTRCPIVICTDRVAAARQLADAGVDLVLCDDGLQHLRLARDCEIVVIDASRGLGNGRLLPAGPLREGAERLRHADAIVVNGEPDTALRRLIAAHGGPAPLVMRLEPSGVLPVMGSSGAANLSAAVTAPGLTEAVNAPATATGLPATGNTLAGVDARSAADLIEGPAVGRALADLRGQRVHAVAGIGNPGRFFGMLRAQGIEVIEHAFPDHHPFTPRDLAFGDRLPILMTEKDAVRCAGFATPGMWFIAVDAVLSDADAHALLACVRGRMARGTAAPEGLR